MANANKHGEEKDHPDLEPYGDERDIYERCPLEILEIAHAQYLLGIKDLETLVRTYRRHLNAIEYFLNKARNRSQQGEVTYVPRIETG